MKKTLKAVFLTAMLIFSVMPSVYSAENIIYVSESGSDTNSDGSLTLPYASLKKTVENANSGDKIIIEEGSYYADAPIDIKKDNISVVCDGEVVFTGAKQIKNDDFSLVKDPNKLMRMRKEARGNIYSLSLSSYGINADYGYDSYSPTGFSYKPRLFIDGVAQTEARYPNSGFMSAENEESDNVFSTSDSRASNWKNAKNAFIVGSFTAKYNWRRALATFGDNGEITAVFENNTNVRNTAEFYVTNLLEEIDAVGEYCIDFENNELFCYLPSDFSEKTAEISYPLEYPLITIKNAKNISIEGIKFEKISNRIFEIKNCDSVSIKNCSFDYIDADYVIWAGDYKSIVGNKNISVSENNAYGCTCGFMSFAGGDINTLTPGNIVIENNRIMNSGGEVYSMDHLIRCGIAAPHKLSNSVGNAIKNNIIGNCANVGAIMPIGNNIDVAYNEIYNVGSLIDDGGAVYVGKSNTKYGIAIHNNYIHNLNKAHVYSGIYSDDGQGGAQIYNNILRDMRYPIHIGMGMNNSFNDNLLIDTTYGILSQSRMLWGGIFSDSFKSADSNWSLKYETEYMLSNEKTKDAFAAEYSELTEALKRTPFFAPWGSEIKGNVAVGNMKNALWEIPVHSYYAEDGESLTVPEEESVETIVFTDESEKYVDELRTYGGKYENNIKLESYEFSDEKNQNYSLVTTVSDSTVNSINAEEIGIAEGKNAKAFETDEFDFYSSYSDGKLLISLKKPKNASEYEISVNDTVYNYVDNNIDSAYETDDLESGKSYEITIKAKGLARQNMFEASKTKTVSIPDESASFDFAKSLLSEEIKSAEAAKFSYSDENAVANMKSAFENAQTEEELYNALAEAQAKRAVKNSIVKCEISQSDGKVTLLAEGYEPNEKVTALVTNPNFIKSDFGGDNGQASIRYFDVVYANNCGEAEIVFDTRSDGIDFLGKYNVYLSSANGDKTLEASYDYQTFEISDVSYMKNGSPVTDLSLFKGEKITASMNIKSGLDYPKKSLAVLGIYSGDSLISLDIKSDLTLLENEQTTVSFEFTVPFDYSPDKYFIQAMAWDGEELLKPLTIKKIFN